MSEEILKVRSPAVAGSWYAGTSARLRKQIEDCFTTKLGPSEFPKVVQNGPRNLIALVCPHAGYLYSGSVAAHAYFKLAEDGKPDVIALLGPNHTGRGSALSIMNEGVWRTPLGDIKIDVRTANKILDETQIIAVDDSAHAYEHSIELQLPFLQYLFGSSFQIVPICFLLQDLRSSREVGIATAKALSGANALIIASSDMTHYEPYQSAERKDRMVLSAALELDEEKYYSLVDAYGISTCGYGPVIAAITAAKLLGAEKAQLLCYKTSGDVTNDLSAVVGYASLSFTKR